MLGIFDKEAVEPVAPVKSVEPEGIQLPDLPDDLIRAHSKMEPLQKRLAGAEHALKVSQSTRERIKFLTKGQGWDVQEVNMLRGKLNEFKPDDVLKAEVTNAYNELRKHSSHIKALTKQYFRTVLVDNEQRLIDAAREPLRQLAALQHASGMQANPNDWWDKSDKGSPGLMDTNSAIAISQQWQDKVA